MKSGKRYIETSKLRSACEIKEEDYLSLTDQHRLKTMKSKMRRKKHKTIINNLKY